MRRRGGRDGPEADQLYRITYDGSITDEPQFVVMGGTTEPISAELKDTYRAGLELGAAVEVAVQALQATDAERQLRSGGNGRPATGCSGWARWRWRCSTGPGRAATFRRITGAALRELLPEPNRGADSPGVPEVAGGDDVPAGGGPEDPAGS